MASNTTHPRAGRREWTGLAVIAVPCLPYAMDLTVLTLAVPALSADLRPGSTELLWIVDIYGSSSRASSSRWGRWATASGAGCCSSGPWPSAAHRCSRRSQRAPRC